MRRAFLISFFLFFLVNSALAEPCLLVYPQQKTVFRFDPSRYELILEGDPRYNPDYGLSGRMLWDRVNDRTAFEIYRAPLLQGFEESYTGRNEFFAPLKQLTVIVDGYNDVPRRLNDIYIRFNPFPADALLNVWIDGVLLDRFSYRISYLSVTTPLSSCYYSDTVPVDVEWTGAKTVLVTVFSDKNGNRVYDGEPCFSILMEDPQVPVEKITWGHIKSLYKE
ncbi:MAG: hypothetical protein ACFFH0_12100 [Promethearchaeota archaeon]